MVDHITEGNQSQPFTSIFELGSTLSEVDRKSRLYSQFAGMAALKANVDRLHELDNQVINPETDNEKRYSAVEFFALINDVYTQTEGQDNVIKNLRDTIDYQREQNLIGKSNWAPKSAEDFRQKYETGVGWQESDWQWSADGVPVVSHSSWLRDPSGRKVKINGRKVKISDLTAEQLSAYGVANIDDVFGVISEYASARTSDGRASHGMVMEIKNLGATPEQRSANIELFKTKINQYGLTENIAFSAVAKTDLIDLHKGMYEDEAFRSPVISNTDYCPVLSAEKGLASGLVKGLFKIIAKAQGSQEWAKFGNYELAVVSWAEKSSDDQAGDVHILAKMPSEALAAMQQEYADDPEAMGGAVGMAVGFAVAWNILKVFNRKYADKYLRSYIDMARADTADARLQFITKSKDVDKIAEQLDAYEMAGANVNATGERKEAIKYIPGGLVANLALKRVLAQRRAAA
jgi:glycerophosphoryl diester phosphodiesterase